VSIFNLALEIIVAGFLEACQCVHIL
jgi:hypothetical protein